RVTSLRVELDDQLLVDGRVYLVPTGMVLHDHLPLTGINLHPVGNDSILGVYRVLDDNYVLAPLLDRDHITGADLIRRDVNFLAVDEKVPVVDELAGLRPGCGQAGTPNDVVEALFEEQEEVVTGDPG